MPLSILLTDTLGVLTAGVGRLGRWESLTDRFALVVERLRSAWLVRWFGTGVPISGIDVRVTIANLDELRRRWAQIGAGRRSGPGALGPNLTEPLLGDSGALVGMLAAPLNSLLLLMVLDHVTESLLGRIGIGLAWLSGGGLVTIVAIVAAPLIAFGLVPGAIAGQASDVYDLLGALGGLGRPLARLWAQVTGRAPVANPLLRALLRLLDRFAALAAMLLAVVAVVVTRIAPLLAPIRDAAVFTILAVLELADAIRLVIDDTIGAVRMLWRGMSQVLTAVKRSLKRVFESVATHLRAGFQTIADGLTARLATALSAATGWIPRAVRFLVTVVFDNPVVRWFFALRGVLATLSAWSRRPGPPPSPAKSSPPSPWLTSFPWPASVRALGVVLRHTPPAPSLGPVPDLPLLGTDLVRTLAGAMRLGILPSGTDPFELTPDQHKAIARFRRPPSVLAGLRAELRDRARSPEATGRILALADTIERITPFVTRSAGLLVPQATGSFLPRLAGVLADIDATLRRIAAEHPTRLLEEPTEVRPVVGRLVVRADGASAGGGGPTRAQAEAFVSSLRRALDARPYPVPAGG